MQRRHVRNSGLMNEDKWRWELASTAQNDRQLPRPERRRRSGDGACVASAESCGPGPTCLPVRSVGRGNLIGRDLGDFAAGRADSERLRRWSVLRGRLTAARPERGTKPSPHRNVGSAPVAGLSEARFGLHRTTSRATLTVSSSFATRSSPPYRSLRSRLRKGTPRHRLVETVPGADQDQILDKLDEIVSSPWRDPPEYGEPLQNSPYRKIRIGEFRLSVMFHQSDQRIVVARIKRRGGAYTADD